MVKHSHHESDENDPSPFDDNKFKLKQCFIVTHIQSHVGLSGHYLTTVNSHKHCDTSGLTWHKPFYTVRSLYEISHIVCEHSK